MPHTQGINSFVLLAYLVPENRCKFLEEDYPSRMSSKNIFLRVDELQSLVVTVQDKVLMN